MAEPLFSFGLIADCQYADVDDWAPSENYGMDRRFRSSLTKLQEAVDFFNARQLAFVVHLGDLIDQQQVSFAKVLPVLAQSKAPVWQVAGNHDFCGEDYVYGEDREGTLKNLGLESFYYAKESNGWRFITIDGNEQGVIEWKEGTPEWQAGQAKLDELKTAGKVNAQSWNGAIGPEQKAWLLNELEQAEAAGQNSVIFCHQSIYPKHRENLLNDEQLLPELGKFKHLRAFINGHNHDGNYGQYRNLHCLTVHGMVDTQENAYAVANVFPDRLIIEGFGREPDRVMKFESA